MSNHSQCPSSAKSMTGSSSFHNLNSSGGKLRPTSAPPGDLREHLRQVDADEHQADGDDAEVQPAEADGGRRDDDPDQRGADAGAGQPDPHRQAEAPQVRRARLAAEDDRRVGADAHEEGVAERHLAGDAGEQVEPERGDGEDHRLRRAGGSSRGRRGSGRTGAG